MAKVFIEETTLTAIGDAIRDKTGKTELIDPANMHNEIAAIVVGGGGEDLPEEAFLITGKCDYRFAYGGWDWFVSHYKDKLVTSDITSLFHTFEGFTLKAIPFDINITKCGNLQFAFNGLEVTECPRVRGTFSFSSDFSLYNMMQYCSYLRDIEDLFEPSELDGFTKYRPLSTSTNPRLQGMLAHCRSLRRLPSWLSKLKLNPESTAISTTYHIYNNFCYGCATLDEALDIPVWTCTNGVTSNMFGSYFLANCNRLKDFTFETDNGQPVAAKWKTQTITINTNIGYGSTAGNIYGYNSGVTADKEVKDDATYQALKNDPDWFATKEAYSRYNHDSAVRTINSLPDTSAYLATAGGTNTIKFKGTLGSATDGGAINTLTAEEIAVATAKGWTVTLV